MNVVENVIVVMLEKKRIFPNEVACLAYMKTIIRNSAKNVLRKSDEILMWERYEKERALGENAWIDEEFDNIEIKEYLKKLIEEYPYEIREAFVLHVLDGILFFIFFSP